MSAVIVWSVVEVTFRLGFDRPATGSWIILSYATEVLFFLDMFVTFRTALLTRDGVVVAGKEQVARAYLKARGGAVASSPDTFPLDFWCRRSKVSLPHLDSDSIRVGLSRHPSLECDTCIFCVLFFFPCPRESKGYSEPRTERTQGPNAFSVSTPD